MNVPRAAWAITLLVFALIVGVAQVPQLIHFQGELTMTGARFDGLGEFKFSLVNSNGSRSFWSNDGTGREGNEPSNSVSVAVRQGMFSVVLGDSALSNMTAVPTTVFTNEDVRLRIWFRSAGKDKDDDNVKDPEFMRRFELLSPDKRITAVGYAMFAANVPDGLITAAKLADGAVTREKLAPDAITPPTIPDGSITTRKLADYAVDNLKIAPGAVGESKLAATAVTADKIAPGAIGSVALADASVTNPKIANRAVTGEKIAFQAVSAEQMADEAVTTAKLSSASVTAEKLGAGVALTNLIASGFSGVPSGALILSYDGNATSLTNAGYVRASTITLSRDQWEIRNGPLHFFPQFAVWTGTEVIAGGTSADPSGFQGACYNPVADSWRPITSLGAPSFRELPVSCWTGSDVIVWGGYDSTTGQRLADGYLYNATTDRWRPMTGTSAPFGLAWSTAVWTGSEMIVWGGRFVGSELLNVGRRYDPMRNLWRAMSTNGSPSGRIRHKAIWTGKEMIIWGGQIGANPPRTVLNTGGRYRPDSDTWTDIPTNGAPSGAAEHTVTWTGEEMIVWGGGTSDYAAIRGGGRFSPAGNTWRPIASLNAPLGRAAHVAVWTGVEMVIWGGGYPGASGIILGGGRYNPATDEWLSLTTDSAPTPLKDAEAFWLGNGMLVAGGRPEGRNLDNSIMPFWRPPIAAYLYQRQ